MPYIINNRVLDGIPNIKITHISNNTELMHSIHSTPLGVVMNEELKTGKVQVVSDVGGVLFEHEKNIPCSSTLTQQTYQFIFPESRAFITSKKEVAILAKPQGSCGGGVLYTIPLVELDCVETIKYKSKVEYLRDCAFNSTDQNIDNIWGEGLANFIKFVGGYTPTFYTSIYPIPEHVTLGGEFLLPELNKFKKQTYVSLHGIDYLHLDEAGEIHLAPQLIQNNFLKSLNHHKDSDRITVLIHKVTQDKSDLTIELLPLSEYKMIVNNRFNIKLTGLLVDEV